MHILSLASPRNKAFPTFSEGKTHHLVLLPEKSNVTLYPLPRCDWPTVWHNFSHQTQGSWWKGRQQRDQEVVASTLIILTLESTSWPVRSWLAGSRRAWEAAAETSNTTATTAAAPWSVRWWAAALPPYPPRELSDEGRKRGVKERKNKLRKGEKSLHVFINDVKNNNNYNNSDNLKKRRMRTTRRKIEITTSTTTTVT